MRLDEFQVYVYRVRTGRRGWAEFRPRPAAEGGRRVFALSEPHSIQSNEELPGMAGLHEQDEYILDSRHLTLPSPPSGKFTLEIVTEIYPQKNTSLEGLYKSSGSFCTQCEAEGFWKITFYQDRPDIMAKYTWRIEGDMLLCLVLLSNGNLAKQGELEAMFLLFWYSGHCRQPSRQVPERNMSSPLNTQAITL